MKKLVRLLTPWWNEKEATEKEKHVEDLSEFADVQISRAQQVARAYRDASLVLATMRK